MAGVANRLPQDFAAGTFVPQTRDPAIGVVEPVTLAAASLPLFLAFYLPFFQYIRRVVLRTAERRT